MTRTTRTMLSLVGCLSIFVVLGGAEGCPIDIVIGDGDGDDPGDGDGDGDGDQPGDGDGDGDTSCQSDADCGPNQLCARPDCAALCEPNADGLCDPVDCGGDGVCIDITPDACAAVDCAPGFQCVVQTVCWEGDCDPAEHPNCTGGCDEEPVCIPVSTSCESDADCGPGFHCEWYDYYPEPAPCWDENGDGQCDDGGQEDRIAGGICVEDYEPWTCDNIDCGPGYHCETEVYCYDDCGPNGDCWGECFEEPVCLPDGEPIQCWDDSMCPDGWRCEYYGYDEPVPGDCDPNSPDGCAGLVAPEGYCVPGYEPPSCALIDCGPGYACEEITECYEECWAEPGDPNDPDQPSPPPCEVYCETYPTCVPTGNDECWDLDPNMCEQVPGCHLEEVYPGCDGMGAFPCIDEDGDGQCDDIGDPIPPCDPEPYVQCVPDFPNEGTCAGHCGGAGSNGSCFCDDVCVQFGDCCGDFYEFCEEIVPDRCESDADCAQGEACELREICYDDFGMGTECYVEGYCVPVVEPDPCASLPVDVCAEVVGCHVEEIWPPCANVPCFDEDGDGICDNDPPQCEPVQICVSDYEPPPPPPDQCQTDADCMGGQCVTETFCLDYCDQNVPDPECCFTQSYCENQTDPPVCAQVETPATNPETGSCVVFPTPCDVPPGWQPGC